MRRLLIDDDIHNTYIVVDFELVPLSLCPGTRTKFLSLCPEKLHCPVPLETLVGTTVLWTVDQAAIAKITFFPKGQSKKVVCKLFGVPLNIKTCPSRDFTVYEKKNSTRYFLIRPYWVCRGTKNPLAEKEWALIVERSSWAAAYVR